MRVGILALFLNLEENLSAFTIVYDVTCGLIIYDLSYFEVHSFYHEKMLSFVEFKYSHLLEWLLWEKIKYSSKNMEKKNSLILLLEMHMSTAIMRDSIEVP
jgi:hypothetical protein